MKKTSKESYETQRNTAKKNENKILSSLLEHPKTFTELLKEIDLSQTGLSKILKRLEENKLIQHPEYSKAYELTSKGKRNAKAIPVLQYNLEEIISHRHNYKSNYFSENDIKWSLLSELESPRIKYNTFIDKISNEYRELILMNIKERYVTENEDKTYSIINAEDLKGKHIIAFEIDFDLIRQNIEDALKSDSAFKDTVKTVKQGITRGIKEDIRNLYRHVLFNEERKAIFSQKDNEVDDQ